MKHLFLALLGVWIGFAASAQTGYRINPGDVLAVEVVEDASLNREVLVLPDGSFNFPFAGTVQARGLTVEQVQSAVTQGISSNFAAPPNVFVTVRQVQPAAPRATGGGRPASPRTIEIYFLGEVNNIGPADIPPGTTLLQALSRAGGFTNFAALRRIQLRRTDPATGAQYVSEIDYRAISNGARLSTDITLYDGDVILVPERRLFE
ncbi:polysaccharide biosynthesis/export family protein [Jannaschia sp. CCS1]|uniref:polysaccharide biosynthesis/export family protein n=1 Tax=Jannaschia sp. (strain CCS1) TaxID=290400 RepID=UPI000053D798|nr:polysaccharide biosynthesis/export family protein [Jannaschia sp. CCS1]ABD57151.1 polysaccharide export protein [Jannaschia sp. CCS1]